MEQLMENGEVSRESVPIVAVEFFLIVFNKAVHIPSHKINIAIFQNILNSKPNTFQKQIKSLVVVFFKLALEVYGKE